MLDEDVSAMAADREEIENGSGPDSVPLRINRRYLGR
jgi:hypothetical protein